MVALQSSEMILVRTRCADRRIIDWAEAFGRSSGLPTTLMTDGRSPCPPAEEPDNGNTLRMTRAQDRQLGLYSPPDTSWRCGDYGFYIARRHFPDVTHFWMIEDDVRISGDPGFFFRYFSQYPNIDFLAANMAAAESTWWWHSHASARNVRPQKSFFPVVRLSAVAIDYLLSVRQRQSRCWLRRSLWPNDEVFVATTLKEAAMQSADLNGLDHLFYGKDTFGYGRAVDPSEVDALASTKLYHPVLTTEDQTRRAARLRATTINRRPLERFQIAIFQRLNRWTYW